MDDEPDILASLEALIRDAIPGVAVRLAGSGAAGLQVLRGEPVDLMLVDYKMPGMDGLQFLAQARKISPSTASVMITAFPDPVLAARAVLELGVGLFVAKPFEPGYVSGLVRAILDSRP